jgi:benzoyl-CoA reductase/2-hydroxyglutaryl-CoA dehydratase subunit BcrC/BadD/HgdB
MKGEMLVTREALLKKWIEGLYHRIEGAMKMMETYPPNNDAKSDDYWQGMYDARHEVLKELRGILIKHEALVKGRRNFNAKS